MLLNSLALWGHRLVYRLGQFVSLIYGRETRVPQGAPQVDLQRQIGLVWDFLPSCPLSFLPYFILLFNYYSCVCFFLLFHPCCSHARGILCGIHTSCMGSALPIVYAEWIMLCRVEKDCFKRNNNNKFVYSFV